MDDGSAEYGDDLVNVSGISLHELDELDGPVLARELRRHLDSQNRDAELAASFGSYIDDQG